jgi:uncharacterized protein YkwD
MGPGGWLARVTMLKAVQGVLLAAILAGCVHLPGPPPDVTRKDPALDRVMSLQEFDHALLSSAIFQETNLARAANGAPLLRGLPALDDAADMQASYLALTLTVGHTSMFPHEHDVGQRVTQAGLQPARVGENAIMMPARRPPDGPKADYTYREYAAFLVEGWLNSPVHRETMMDRRFTDLGCAARLANGFGAKGERIFATQVFFLPSEHALVQP